MCIKTCVRKSLSCGGNAPSFVLALQYLECIYLIARGYYIFTTIVFAFSLAGQAGLILSIRQQHKIMSGMISQRGIVPLLHRGWVRALPAWKLVPGDVVVLQRGKAACDMVLLKGSCLVEESMLSGEVWDRPCTPRITT